MAHRYDVCPRCGGRKVETAWLCVRCRAAERAARRAKGTCPFCRNPKPGYQTRLGTTAPSWCCARAAQAGVDGES